MFNIHRHKSSPFHVVLVGGDELISVAVQAMAVAHTRGLSPGVLTFNIVPTGKKECEARCCVFPSSEGTDVFVYCSSWPCCCSGVHSG